MNENIRNEVHCRETIIDVIRKRKLTLFGDIYCMSDQRLIKTLLFGKAESRNTTMKEDQFQKMD